MLHLRLRLDKEASKLEGGDGEPVDRMISEEDTPANFSESLDIGLH